MSTYIETEPAFVPVQTRSERPTSVDVADFEKVTGRETQWKYTPVAELTELTEGELSGGSYDFQVANTRGIRTSWVPRDHELVGSAGLPEDRASANAWTHFERALLVELSGDESFEATLTRSALGTAARAAHTIVSVAPNTHATLILENRGDAVLAENVEIVVGDGANLTLVSVQDWSDSAKHVAAHFAKVGRDAKLKHVVVSLGGKIVRLNPQTRLAGPGADVELLGVYFADAGQHLEHQVYVFHEAAHGTSRVTYKGALQGEGAHTVWIGDVLIGPDAVGTDSYEQNRNLVLTEGTRADSVPNLEIETGDIAGAGHASATGRFDDEQLFYLQSRGITEDEARRLVVRGFLVEIVQQIGVASLEERLNDAIEAELQRRARVSAVKVCSFDELVVNQAKRVVVEGVPIALVRDAEDMVYAIGDTCTHGDISLAEGFVEGDTIECWAHGSQFSLTSGKPLNLPAYEPVPVFEVEIADGEVLIDPSLKKVNQ